MALAQLGGVGRGGRLIIALGDRLLREALAMALAEEGFRLLEFARADAALAHIEAGTDVDALIVDAAASGTHDEPGDRPRDRLRAARCASPVFVLSAHGEALAAADSWGAAGVIDRTQPFANLKRNLINAIRASALLAEPAAPGTTLGVAHSQGPLVIGAAGAPVSWKGCYLDLSPAEQALLSGLVAAPAPGLTIQRALTILAALEEDGSGDGSGGRTDGSAARVKSLVRRLRKKFREVDPDFDQIVFVPGCGYSWRGGDAPPG